LNAANLQTELKEAV
jgi:hypothetical protein